MRWLFPVLIVVVALLLRLVPLNRYVTPDEPAWVYRSFRFNQALAANNLSAIPATGHPGMTTMWLGGIGLQIHRWLAPDQTTVHLDWLNGLAGLSPKSAAAFRHLAFFLSGGRVLVALVTSLGLAGVFALASRLWGRPTAMLAALLLALDPFLAGHSGLLHLDGLLTTAMTLSALAALLAVRSPARGPTLFRWFALSGLMAGLAVLTKTPGGFLLPSIVLLVLAAWLTQRVSWRRGLIALMLWALTAGLTCLALYPSLWADPAATLRVLVEAGGRHVEGAIRPVFFNGQMTYRPGAAFYPIVWLFRTSPLVLIGLPVALIVHVRRPGPRRFGAIALIVLAVGFGLLITLAGKKHDRYLLPAFPPLTLVAALGWDSVTTWIGGRLLDRAENIKSPILTSAIPHLPTIALILIQLLLTLPFLSAPLGYFNPLLGGPRAALDWLQVGWDEGLGAAARWLNQQPDAEHLVVATPSIPSFASFFAGQTVLLSQETLVQADYIANPPRQGADQLPLEEETQALVYENQVGGISYARITRNTAPLEQAAYLDDQAHPGDLIILDAEAAVAHLYDGPADLAVLADAGDSAQVAERLNGLIPGHERLWYVALPVASPITARHIQQQLSGCGPLVSSETIAGATIGLIDLDEPQPCDALARQDTKYETRFGDALALTGALLPDGPIAWPERIRLVVRWQALNAGCPGGDCRGITADYRVALHLEDEAGRTWVEGGQEMLDTDYRQPSAWPPGHWSDQTFKLALPPAIPPGRYRVELGVFDPVSGVGLSAWDAEGRFAGLAVKLGQVTIAPPSRPPAPWEAAATERNDPPIPAGPLALLGADLPPERIASGDRVSFGLLWQATSAPGASYALRWRLATLEGGIALEEVAPLSPHPTALWRDRELEKVRYDVTVPPDLPTGDYGLLLNVLDADGAPLWDADHVLAQVEILARDRLFSLPSSIAYPLDYRLGSVVHLRGFDIGARAAQPGDTIPLTLYWQADGPTDLGYTVFVHLIGPDGAAHGQVDRQPAGGAAPTHSWARGQVVIDEMALPVLDDAPPGTYHIAMGLYNQDNAVRTVVYDATGIELPNRQIVLPIEVTVE